MYLSNYTETQQSNFASFCKTNILQPIDGLTENRIHHYRRLIYAVIDDSLRSAFPLTENLLTEDDWKFLVDEFVAKHSSQSPQVWQMPYEFYQFIVKNEFKAKIIYPHLVDLLLFEWKEVELYMMEDLNEEIKNLSSEYNSASRILINKEYEILQLDFPVHLKSPAEISKEDSGKYFVLIFRAKDRVWFYDIAPVFVWLISELENGDNPLSQIIEDAAQLNSTVEKEIIKQNFLKFIKTMHSKGFVLGFENNKKIK